MLIAVLTIGVLGLTLIAVAIGMSLDTEAQRRAHRRVAQERRSLAVERRALIEQSMMGVTRQPNDDDEDGADGADGAHTHELTD